MSVAVEKSGFKLKIPPDDYAKSERSKPGNSFKKSDKKKFREPKPNLQKEKAIEIIFSWCKQLLVTSVKFYRSTLKSLKIAKNRCLSTVEGRKSKRH